MDIVALLVIAVTTLASVVVAVLTLRAMARDNEELSRFVGFARLPLSD